ncbi:hypothetical protein DF164_31245 [Burkholderia stagnalis]|nr:hypothetical protein DF164_31245 [Burkholderia stagnalis]RQY64933.1 hypothetical protein DF110_30770 [Burkholderia stagnalis]
MRKSGIRGHRPLSKTQLLPLPAYQARRLSLKHHLALACLANEGGDVEMLSTLSNVIELAHQLDKTDAVLFRNAEAAIGSCVARAEKNGTLALTDAERDAIAAVLVYHDAQLSRVPIHRYLAALEHLAVQARQLGRT